MLRLTVKKLGTMTRPFTSTERWSSISRTSLRPISIGRSDERKARANTPSTIRSRRRSKALIPIRGEATEARIGPRGRHRDRRLAPCAPLCGQSDASSASPQSTCAVRAPMGPRRCQLVAFHPLTRASGGMADALASGASVRKDVGVQVPPRPRDIASQTPRSRSRCARSAAWVRSETWSLSRIRET